MTISKISVLGISMVLSLEYVYLNILMSPQLDLLITSVFTLQMKCWKVCNTNAYAKWMIHKKCEQIPNYVDKLLSMDGSNDVNLTELKAYFGILIILGLNPVKQYQMAFSCDPCLGNEGIRNYDPLYKTQPIIKALSKSFMQFMAGSTFSAIDELMIRCKSTLPYIVYQV